MVVKVKKKQVGEIVLLSETKENHKLRRTVNLSLPQRFPLLVKMYFTVLIGQGDLELRNLDSENPMEGFVGDGGG